jgi:hypothetical protein
MIFSTKTTMRKTEPRNHADLLGGASQQGSSISVLDTLASS